MAAQPNKNPSSATDKVVSNFYQTHSTKDILVETNVSERIQTDPITQDIHIQGENILYNYTKKYGNFKQMWNKSR